MSSQLKPGCEEFSLELDGRKVDCLVNIAPGNLDKDLCEMPLYQWHTTGYTVFGHAICRSCGGTKLVTTVWSTLETAAAQGVHSTKALLPVWAAVHDCKGP